MYKRILVALDDSVSARLALEEAIRRVEAESARKSRSEPRPAARSESRERRPTPTPTPPPRSAAPEPVAPAKAPVRSIAHRSATSATTQMMPPSRRISRKRNR